MLILLLKFPKLNGGSTPDFAFLDKNFSNTKKFSYNFPTAKNSATRTILPFSSLPLRRHWMQWLFFGRGAGMGGEGHTVYISRTAFDLVKSIRTIAPSVTPASVVDTTSITTPEFIGTARRRRSPRLCTPHHSAHDGKVIISSLSLKPRSACTGTVFTIFGSSRASKSKRQWREVYAMIWALFKYDTRLSTPSL